MAYVLVLGNVHTYTQISKHRLGFGNKARLSWSNATGGLIAAKKSFLLKLSANR